MTTAAIQEDANAILDMADNVLLRVAQELQKYDINGVVLIDDLRLAEILVDIRNEVAL